MAFKFPGMSIVALTLLFGCASVSKLETHLNSRTHNLGYIQDSKPLELKKRNFVWVEKPKLVKGLSEQGKVFKLSTSVAPLIIYTGWKQQFEYRLGDQQLQQQISEFVQQAIIKEANRSSSFIADSIGGIKDDFKLKIEIQNVQASGSYKTQGFVFYAVFFALYSSQHMAGPSSATSSIKYTLTKNDKIILENTAVSTDASDPLKIRYSSVEKLQMGYSSTLAEQLSQSLKINIETCIREVNRFLLAKYP
jgi:hypothetical protein